MRTLEKSLRLYKSLVAFNQSFAGVNNTILISRCNGTYCIRLYRKPTAYSAGWEHTYKTLDIDFVLGKYFKSPSLKRKIKNHLKKD